MAVDKGGIESELLRNAVTNTSTLRGIDFSLNQLELCHIVNIHIVFVGLSSLGQQALVA